MHILEDPELSERVWLLLRHARRMPSMAVPDTRAWAKAETADGTPTGLPAGALDALVRFEERYGGLWYPNTGYSPRCNGMEYGLDLDGEPLVWESPFGRLIPSACVDGDWTWGVDLLLDGRTMIDLGSGNEPFLVDRDLPQRIEHHAQRALVHNWPHSAFHWETPAGTDPALTAGPLIPPRDDAASSPADHWWTAPDIAVHLHAPDAASRRGRWLVRCHTRHGTDLSALREATLAALPAGVESPATWCSVCERATAPYELCDDPHQGWSQRRTGRPEPPTDPKRFIKSGNRIGAPLCAFRRSCSLVRMLTSVAPKVLWDDLGQALQRVAGLRVTMGLVLVRLVGVGILGATPPPATTTQGDSAALFASTAQME